MTVGCCLHSGNLCKCGISLPGRAKPVTQAQQCPKPKACLLQVSKAYKKMRQSYHPDKILQATKFACSLGSDSVALWDQGRLCQSLQMQAAHLFCLIQEGYEQLSNDRARLALQQYLQVRQLLHGCQ